MSADKTDARVLSGEDFAGLPVDDQVDYLLAPAERPTPWVQTPLRVVIGPWLYGLLSPAKQAKFRWDRASARYVRRVA